MNLFYPVILRILGFQIAAHLGSENTVPKKSLATIIIAPTISQGSYIRKNYSLAKYEENQMSHEKNPYYFPLYLFLNRDPYTGLLKSLYNWVVFHPLYNPTNQGLFSLLKWLL